MLKVEDYIQSYQAIPNLKIITSLIKFLNKSFKENNFKAGGIRNGKNNDSVDKEVRDVDILGLNNLHNSLSNVHWYNFLSYLIINQMRKYVQKFPHISDTCIFDMQALRYGVGGHYKFHVDDGTGLDRKYSSILLLNNDYEGGELCFKIGEKIIKIETSPGKLIVWPSNFMFPHSVRPLTKGTRYSIVSWMH